MELNRRGFLIGLFGTAVAAAMPKVLEQLSDEDFKKTILDALPPNDEIYGNGSSNYAFAKVEWLDKAPWIKVTVPEGYKPLREESNRLGAEAIARMKGQV